MDAVGSVRDVAVDGMHCAGCADSVRRLLVATPGVEEARVSAATRRAVVRGPAGLEALDAALARGGYALGRRTTRLEGLEAGQRAELERLPGVRRVTGDGSGLSVEHVDADDVLDALRALVAPLAQGRLSTERDPEERRLAAEARGWRWRFLAALPVAVALLVAGMPHGGAAHGATPPGDARLWWLLSLATCVVSGGPILAGALAALRRRRGDMDLLVGLGVVTALAGSAQGAFGAAGAPSWLESAVGIVTLVALGRWLEARTRRATGHAVAHLARMAPATAWLVEAAGDREVPVERLLVGDRLRVKPGGAVPTDGVVLEGRGWLDESLLTGESLPVERGPGAPVIGGTLAVDGSFVLEARAVGAATALARIGRWVREAQSSRAPVARLADRLAAVFVPAVLASALLTLALNALGGADPGLASAVERAVAVLVVACPCALGLAVPTAIVAATGRGARRGILFKGGETLERCAEVDCVVFDKTGTLTEGRPAVRQVLTDGTSVHELLRLAAAVERASEHPLARAVVAHALAEGLTPPEAADVSAVAGAGASGRVDARRVLVGRVGWLEEQGVAPTPFEPWLAAADAQGLSAVLVAVDGRAAGAILVGDAERATAAAALRALARDGIAVALLSGDRPAVVTAVARRLGVADAQAGVTPLEKGVRVGERMAQGRVCAFVGDGVNDAPALAAADVGLALGGASAVSAAAAGVALTGPDLTRVPEALALARAARRTIRRNLAWASVYNLAALPLAALGALPPTAAAGAMAASSLSVMLSSLWLARWRWPGAS